MSTNVRAMVSSDLERVAELAGVLGGTVPTRAQMAERFARIMRAGNEVLFVAEHEREARVVGFIHGVPRWLLEIDAYAEILALAVDPDVRRVGAGRALVEHVVAWARTAGFARVRVRSNVVRVESHAFYPALGFERVKTQHNYELRLGRP